MEFYAIFEGNDGSGKTTTMGKVAARLAELLPTQSVLSTHHPGSTALGKHLRQLVKFPETIDPEIKIDGLSRQLLYMVDTISFVKTLLEPALAAGQVVLADRSSFISALVYGLSDGLTIKDIDRLFSLLLPPKADRLYVLTCDWKVGRDRVMNSRATTGTDGQGTLDHYDRETSEFYAKVADLYENLITRSPEMTALVSRSVAVENVIYVDAELPPQQVVDIIANDLVRAIRERSVGSTSE